MFFIVGMLLAFLSGFSIVLGFFPIEWEERPTLQPFAFESEKPKQRKSIFSAIKGIAIINRPICSGGLRQRMAKDLAMGQVGLNPEEFFLVKELVFVFVLYIMFLVLQPNQNPDTTFFWGAISLAAGYMLPEFWLKSKVTKIKGAIVKELPDAIDLLGLCVNAGLDFMLALKWVVDKSPPSYLMREFSMVMQEISVGKTRRDAIRDLSKKYNVADLSSLSRTLIQADKMGTSVSEALNFLSEDMRISRFRRGEKMALKAPLKMLIPLFLIFGVVGILVAGPIFIEFLMNNPMQSMGR
ncbi:MAG: type II secretion system F family protein [bacterium]|nr:type II secretion system F family protein [bacterium]